MPDNAAAAPGVRSFLSRSAVLGIYLPVLVFEVGVGAVTPMVAVSATGLGGSLAQAGLLAAMLGVGQIAGDVPAGALAARIGDRAAMLVAACVAVVTLAGCALARSLPLLGLCVLATGAVNAVFMLARQSYLTEVTPTAYRARALSTLGGLGRVGSFVGPFIGAAVVHVASPSAVFWVAAATSAGVAAVVLAVPDVAGREVRGAGAPAPAGLTGVLRRHAPVFATLGVAILLVGATRGARQVMLPVWTEHLGYAPETTSLVYALSGLLDTLTFYPAGKAMDRWGRLWVGVPSMLVLGGCELALPWAHSLLAVSAVAVVMGLGNGVGAGMIMTLGADVAPAAARSQFLGVWRVLQDLGVAGGPLVVSAGAALGSLAAGISATGVMGLGAAAMLARTVPRWSVHANARTRRAAGLRAAPPSPR